MPISVVEVAYRNVNSGPTQPISNATVTPVAGDIYLFIASGLGARTLSSVSGAGATWTVLDNVNSSGVSMAVAVGTGMTSAADATHNVTGTFTVNTYGILRLYLIRGLAGQTYTIDLTATHSVATTTLNGPSQSVDAGDVVISIIGTAALNTALTWNRSGWTNDGQGIDARTSAPIFTGGTVYQVPSAPATVNTSASTTTASATRLGQVRIRTAPTQPIAATAPMPSAALAAVLIAAAGITATAPMPSASLAGDSTTAAALAATAPMPSAALTATTAEEGQLAATAPMPSAALTAAAEVTGQLAATAPMPSARIVVALPPAGPRAFLERILTSTLPDPGGDDRIDLIPYARDVDPPARETLMIRIDDVVRHPDAPQAARRYGFTLILLGAGDGEQAEEGLEAALEDVLYAVELSPELPQWVKAERAVWRETTPAFEIAVPVDFRTTDPTTTE